MQIATAAPRSAFTAAQITRLIRDDPNVTVGAGCELLDRSLTVLDDFTDDFPGGSVSRNSYATLHGTARLRIARELPFTRAIIRPYITLAGSITARFNLGTYLTSAPRRSTLDTPTIYDVAGFDIIKRLQNNVGEAYAVAAGAFYLAEVEKIFLAQGFSAGTYVIDQTSAMTVLPSARVWPLDDKTTWLTVVNDLLSAIGYQGLWSDWDGKLRAMSYLSPMDRTVEWVYDTDPVTAIVGPERILERDYFDTPNRWVFVRSNNIDGETPVEGNGIFTFVNQYNGDTSVEGRGGDTFTKVGFVEAADQAALVVRGQQTIDSDTQVQSRVLVETSPNPMHWHFDRLTVNDDALGTLQVMSTQWTLPLDGSLMKHEWTLL